MGEEKESKDSLEEICCLIFKHKIHCSLIEESEVAELPKEKRYEFCLNKCPIYKRHRKNTNEDE